MRREDGSLAFEFVGSVGVAGQWSNISGCGCLPDEAGVWSAVVERADDGSVMAVGGTNRGVASFLEGVVAFAFAGAPCQGGDD